MGIKFPVILQLSDKGDSVSTHLVSNIDRSSAIHRTVTNSQRGRFELNPTNAEPACRNLDQGGLMSSSLADEEIPPLVIASPRSIHVD